MKEKWIHPNTITGDAATDGRYLRREAINEYFWREVNKGNHILFVAPRRVGKTSIMKDLAENCPEGFACIYQDIEGVKSGNEFYRRLFELILHCVQRSKIREAKTFIADFFKKHSIEISKSGIKMDTREMDYEKEIKDLIPELKKAEVHTVIFLDEFAEVIHKLPPEDAVNILHTLRELRHDNDFRHFTLVYAGSIGLEFVIKNIDRPKLINDLHRIKLNALTDGEATQLLQQLTKGASIRLPGVVLTYLKQKVDYLLPYYLQLMLEEIDGVAYENEDTSVNESTVDAAFQRVLANRKNFEDWLERLKDYQAAHFPFINDILMHAAHNGSITIQEIYNKAEKFGRTDDYMDFVDELLHDGYLQESEEHLYRFISPFLRQFWLKKYPVYHA